MVDDAIRHSGATGDSARRGLVGSSDGRAPVTVPPSGPVFLGLRLHRDTTLGYSFFVPVGWRRLELESADGSGVIYAPAPDDAATSFSAEGRDLGLSVAAEDLPALRTGFLRGLRALPESVLESSEAESIGSLITLEARHTFRQDDSTRKRWVRLLYHGTTQVRLVAQAASLEQFQYWLPMFYESMRTFRFGDWGTEVGSPPAGP